MLSVTDVHLEIGGTTILEGASLSAAPGKVVAIVGPNGAGKSTLARIAAGIQNPTSGSVHWDGTSARRLGPRRLARIRAFIPQRPTIPAGVSVRDVVELGRAPYLGPLRRATSADRAAVERALERSGTAEMADRRLDTLSGGELQRVQIAIALAQETNALLADEPTSSLDLGAACKVAQLLRSLAVDDGMTVVVVVHDLALAAAIADEVYVMADGRTVATGAPAEVLTGEMLDEVWNVVADIEQDEAGWAAIHVDWLGSKLERSQ